MTARAWIAAQGFAPLPYQEEVWSAMADGASGLVHSSTGTGKTYAVWLGYLPVARTGAGLRALWITPLRALAEDTTLALNRPLSAFGHEWQVELRTGDSAASAKQRQARTPPGGLVTTPESLSLLLAGKDAQGLLSQLDLVVVDEWHELLASKRGTQVELALARLRKWNPNLMVWGLSATLGNMRLAVDVLGVPGVVSGEQNKEIVVRSLTPETTSRFPWAGHVGVQMMPRVAAELEECRSALIFTNTRSQAEIWYQNLSMLLPEWGPQLALHHGSLERAERERVEQGLRTGEIRAVVCTSTLDLGVDFAPVDRVYQIGSPKGVARLIQRAGRSGHQPGATSAVTVVPTHALELIDIAALRPAVAERRVEDRIPPSLPLDVLVQHLVTIALGGGFRADDLFDEVKTAFSFRDLSESQWRWCLDFVTQGGQSLSAYPDFHRVVESDGVYRVENRRIAMMHRMNIGTIVSDAMVRVQFLKGGTLGTVEESFATRLRPGDKFIFAGKPLQFVRFKDLTCFVRPSKSTQGSVVRWMGARMSLSNQLATEIKAKLDGAAHGVFDEPELDLARDLLEIQSRWSAIPELGQLLIERLKSREGHHLFFYPFGGRMVHQGLAALLAYRLSRGVPSTFSISCNDYGFELLSHREVDIEQAIEEGVLSPGGQSDTLMEDIMQAVNFSEMARSQFREIARVAGLVFQGYPGAPKSNKQIRASSSLLYDVFRQYEPGNLLLEQAHREVLASQVEESRLAQTLREMERAEIVIRDLERPTPFGFPLMVARFRETLSGESADERIERLIASLEKAAR
jgi:ATP-dependent helicase Lhr and Lhr-like helicase